jgi:hypothetical protein
LKPFRRATVEDEKRVLFQFTDHTSHLVALPFRMEAYYFMQKPWTSFISLGYSASAPDKCPNDEAEPPAIHHPSSPIGTIYEEVAPGQVFIYSIASWWNRGIVEGDRWNIANFGEKGISFKELTDFIDGKFRKFND